MRKMSKKILYIALAVIPMLFVVTGCNDTSTKDAEATTSVTIESSDSDTEQGNTEQAAEAVTIPVKDISKHGSVVLDTTFDKLKEYDIEVGDVVTVFVGDKEYDLPVGTAYSDVDSGKMICRFDTEDNEVAVGINMGSFAKEAGIGEKQTIDKEPGYQWDIKIPELKLLLKEKKGFLDEYSARNLSRTDAREDYPELTDEEFANFRPIKVTGMKENLFYRSSTPIEPAIGRNEYAMAAMEKAGIVSVLNLDDSVELMKSYDTYPDSYYSKCNIINPEMTYDFETEEFAQKVKDSVTFIINNDGPYLIHCKEGKDRTGILCALLECFAGAPAEDITKDYMTTYYNYYNIKPEDASYSIILNNNLVKTLCHLYKVDSIETTDLKEKAREYFISAGLTEEQLDLLSKKIEEQ